MNRTERDGDLAAVDQALRELPPIDPPRALVQRTLDRVAAQQSRARRARHLGAMALAIAVVLLTVGVALLVQRAPQGGPIGDSVALAPPVARSQSEKGRFTGDDEGESRSTVEEAEPEAGEQTKAEDKVAANWVAERNGQEHPRETAQAHGEVIDGRFWRGPTAGDAGSDDAGEPAQGVRIDPGGTLARLDGNLPVGGAAHGRDGWYRGDDDERPPETVVLQPGFFETTVVSDLEQELEKDGKLGLVTRVPASETGEAALRQAGEEEGLRGRELANRADNGDLASDFAQGLDIPPALRFIPARGYFANTYIPGDGDVVRLDLGRVTSKLGGEAAALEAVRGVSQPFDRPVGQALSLQLAADRTAVEGPTRVTLQVGLAGAAPVKTRRASVACALVVDVASVQDEADRQTLWSVADAFVAERQPGDAFAVVVPRAAGPVVLRGEGLSASELGRALAAAVEERRALDDASLIAAYQAVAEARAATAAPSNKKGIGLGATTVMIATAGPLGADRLGGLSARAHAEALGDVQLSLVGAGARADRAELATLAQRGQGRRWLASSPADARRVIGDELGSAGRTVARAVRLRIRLAPGVKLVGVIGSHPLAVSDQKQVREAEAAIDKHLSDMTGIAADRGEDEDGIQIVIPAFMAGDDHAILLDVVVPGPGPVLDVRMRWKDLLRMDNNEAQASLSLPSGADQATPIALNVVENRAAMVASEALLAAARDIARQRPAAAEPLLSNARKELDALARRAPAVKEQTRVVDHYEALIRGAPAWIQDDAARDEMVRALESTGRMLR